MDLQFIWMIVRTLIALLFVIFLIYISMKYGGGKLRNIQKNNFINVIERAQISKENSLLVVKIGEKVYVISSTSGRIEIVYELNEDEICKLKDKKFIPQYKNLKDFYTKSGMKEFIKDKTNNLRMKKLKYKKEDKNEE